ncbi:MAG: DNA double-strand break repair nuclease NurA [Candidatus Thorarchaeota archaeon]|nr:DNA double-strand break repair nuclease NurA [Candidatus Thorarchaeota archaeon]
MDKNLDKILSQLVEEIERIEITKKRFGEVMHKIKDSINLTKYPAIASSIVNPEFTKNVEATSLAGLRIAGIDGGLVRRQFKSMDLILVRSIAVIFHFGPKEGPTVEFYPDPFPEPQIRPMMLTLSGTELDQLASLERIASELRVTLSVLEKSRVDLILIDGSLFYHPRDRPQSGSIVYEKFQEVLSLYRQLYNKSMKKGTTLAGVVKDSRSSKVTNLLGDILPHILREPAIFELMQGVDYRWLLKLSRDCDTLDTFLDEGERSFIFRYSSELQNNSNSYPDDLSNWASSIWVTYLKTARDDLPLRIELLSANNPENDISKIDRALSVILPLSWQHPEYGIPAPILEADTRARISSSETQLVIDRLMALSGLTYTTLEKRRSRNPFGGN